MQPAKGNMVAYVRLQGLLQVQGGQNKCYTDTDVVHPLLNGIFKNVQGSSSADLSVA